MLSWPRGLRPARLLRAAGELTLLYVAPDRGWVELALAPDESGRGVRVSPRRVRGFDTRAVARLCAGVATQLGRSESEPRRFVNRVLELTTALQRGGARAAALGDTCAVLWRLLADGPLPSDEQLDDVRGWHGDAPAAVAVLLASRGEVVRGLGPVADLEHSRAGSAAAEACWALVAAMQGRPLAAIERARAAAAGASHPIEHFAAARLLRGLGLSADALSSFLAAAHAVDDQRHWLHVLECAADEGNVEVAQHAIEALRCTRLDAEGAEQAGDALVRAGAVEAAMSFLDALEETATSPETLARRAELRLWKLELEQASQLAERASELGAGDRATVVRAAVAICRGDADRGLELLDGISCGEHHSTATLWAVRALFERGDVHVAAQRVTSAAPNDRLIWKLWRSRVKGVINPDETWRGRNTYQLRIILGTMYGSEFVDRAFEESDAAITALVARAIERFGGNYGDRPTFLEDGQLQSVRWVSPRNEAVSCQLSLLTRSCDDVRAAFEEQAVRMPTSPYPETYSAELLLWTGEYEAACEAFRRIWVSTRTRWGYVGWGASLAMLGRHEEALSAWNEGPQYYESYLRAEATYAYRGESHLELGNVDRALRDLQHAADSNPLRLGAFVSLAIARSVAGEPELAAQALSSALRLAPALVCWAAAREGVPPDTQDLGEVERLARRMRAALKGNRASKIYTFFTGEDDEPRVLLAAPEHHWPRMASSSVSAAASVLLEGLLRRELPESYDERPQGDS